jgi:hypothetical protein
VIGGAFEVVEMDPNRLLRWVIAGCAVAVVAVAIAIPTALVPNPFYERMTSPPWWSYPVWVATAVLTGLLIASYIRRPSPSPSPRWRSAAARRRCRRCGR